MRETQQRGDGDVKVNVLLACLDFFEKGTEKRGVERKRKRGKVERRREEDLNKGRRVRKTREEKEPS